MVRYYEGSHKYKYSWDQVARAFWCRYPNPHSKHVLSEDVVDRFVDNNGRLFTKRLLSKTNGVPKFAERIISSRVVFIIEESIVDPINKILVTYTRNIGMRGIMTVDEKVTYKKSSENSYWTEETRQAWISSSFFGLSRAIQSAGLERFRKNVSKTYNGFHLVLETMYSNAETNVETLTSLHPLLKQRLMEKAKTLKEAAKFKTVPLVAAAERSDGQYS